MAELANAQLMEPPEDQGPAFEGAIKQGTGILLDNPTGTVNADLNYFCSKIIAGSEIQILPAEGIGTVTISSTIKIDPTTYIPIGTQMTFFQSGAPPRWITENPGTRMLRITSGRGAGQGGSLPWDSVFGPTFTFTGTPSTGGASISGNTDSVSQTPSGSVSLNGLGLGDASLSVGQLAGHTHQYSRRPPNQNQAGDQGGVAYNEDAGTDSRGGGGGHSHSLSGSGSFSGNNMSHSHSVSGGLSGSGSFSGGNFSINVQYIDLIVCRKLSNPE
jgi:hypothetical protein